MPGSGARKVLDVADVSDQGPGLDHRVRCTSIFGGASCLGPNNLNLTLYRSVNPEAVFLWREAGIRKDRA